MNRNHIDDMAIVVAFKFLMIGVNRDEENLRSFRNREVRQNKPSFATVTCMFFYSVTM